METSPIDELEKILNSEDPRPMVIMPDGTIRDATPAEASAEVSADSPLRRAWDAYRATLAYERSKGWALHIAPTVQAGTPDAEHYRRFEIMPFEQREQHVEGSLWAAFTEGFRAAAGKASG